MFLWARHPAVDDSLWIAEGARREGLRLAPGASFRPLHDASPWMRFCVACVGTARDYRVLARAPDLARAGRRVALAASDGRLTAAARPRRRVRVAMTRNALEDLALRFVGTDPAGETHPFARLEVLVVLEEVRD